MDRNTQTLTSFPAENGIINRRTSLLKHVGIIILLFIYMYSVPLNYFGIPMPATRIFIAISLWYVLREKHLKNVFTDPNYLAFIIGSLLVTVCWLVITCVVHPPNGDFTYIVRIILFPFELLFPCYFFVHLMRSLSIKRLFLYLIIITLVQSLIMAIAVVYPPLKEFVFNVQLAGGAVIESRVANGIEKVVLANFEFRGFALSIDPRLGLSIFHATACLCILWLIANSKRTTLKQYLWASLGFVIISLGGMLGARTFFVSMATYLAIYISYQIIFTSKRGIGLLKFFGVIIISTVIISTTVVPLFITEESEEAIKEFSDWAFEMFNSYEDGTGLNSGSSDELFDKDWKVLPTQADEWILGSHDRTMISGYHYIRRDTDAGYLLLIFHVGIVGSLILYLFWIIVGWMTARLYDKKDNIRVLILAFLVLLFIVQIKAPFMPGSLTLKFLVFLLVIGAERKKLLKSETSL